MGVAFFYNICAMHIHSYLQSVQTNFKSLQRRCALCRLVEKLFWRTQKVWL